jgi:hypothetical protein
MRQLLRATTFLTALAVAPAMAADNAVIITPGSGVTMKSKDIGAGVQAMQYLVCDPTTPSQCVAVSAGGALSASVSQATAANLNATVVQGTAANLNATVVQGTAASLNATVVGTGTFATQSAQSGTWNVNAIQSGNWTVRNVGNAGAITDFAGQNASSPANAWLIGGQFNTSPTTISSGNASPLQLDNAGNLLVNIKAGAAAGGTSLADEATFTPGSTAFTPAGCIFNSSTLSAGQGGAFQCSSDRNLYVNINRVSGALLGTPSTYGVTPTGNAISVNAFVTNSNTNGRATAANSAPVVTSPAPSTAGAIAANNTTAVVVKASAGTLLGVQVYGIGSAPAYLKIYNATSATCGSGTPVKRLMIPAAATAANGAGSNVTFGGGLTFGTGITYCVTTGITDADTTAPAANTYLVNLDYE